MVNITNGWMFHSADGSMAASARYRQKVAGVRVTLIRDFEGQDWWHSLSDEGKDVIELYAIARGDDLEQALTRACQLAETYVEAQSSAGLKTRGLRRHKVALPM